MNRNEEQSPSGAQQFKAMVGWLTFVSSVLAASVEVFLHRARSFGERYIGLQASAVVAAIPLYTLFWTGCDVMPLMRFLAMFLVFCLFIRLGIIDRRRRGGPQVHTRYAGFPRICGILPWLSERSAKMIVEPVLVFVAGVFTMSYSEPLGGYLMLASVGLLFSVRLNANYEHVRALDMLDASIDQRQVAERFRVLRGDRS
jgi:hypothetical protein